MWEIFDEFAGAKSTVHSLQPSIQISVDVADDFVDTAVLRHNEIFLKLDIKIFLC